MSQIEKFCECGCGKTTKSRFAPGHNNIQGWMFGPFTLEHRANMSKAVGDQKEVNNRHWKGGKSKQFEGYIYEFCPTHPFAVMGGYVMQHRRVMENYLERLLEPEEIVHHCNRIKNDNLIENLELTLKGWHCKDYHKPSQEEPHV